MGWRISGAGIIFILCILSGVLSVQLNENGEYTNIVIKVEEDVPEQSCARLLNNLKGLLERTSESVATALEEKLWPGQFTIVIPSHWRYQQHCAGAGLELRSAKGQTRYKKPDILLQHQPTINPTRPWTRQSQGCGKPGDFISLPAEFVNTWNSTENLATSGKLFAHEFIKLRFGIFDEVGYPGDPLYPSSFEKNGEIHPTGVSDNKVEGDWVHATTGQSNCRVSPGHVHNSTCVFHPSGPNHHVSCSLGSFPLLPRVNKYCDKDITGSGPTKQRLVCGGETAREMINSSDDMKKMKRTRTKRLSARVDVVQESTPTHVLVLEITASMVNNHDWKHINKAAHKLIKYDLPDSTRLGVVSFSNESRVESPLTMIRGSRGHLADIIPDKYRLSWSNERCVLCGVNTALTEVLGEHKEGAHLILVTRAGHDTLTQSDMLAIREYVDYYQIRVSVLMIPELGQSETLSFYDHISSQSGGRSMLVSGVTSPVRRYMSVVSALSTISQEDTDLVTVHSEVTRVSDQVTTGVFTLDTALGRDTVFGIIVEDQEDHLIDNVVFESQSGEVFGPYSHVATTYDTINMKTISFGLSRHQPFGEAGHTGQEWSYTVTWHSPGAAVTREAGIMVTSRYSETRDNDVSVNMWTSADQSQLSSGDVWSPVIMYASVSRSGEPVVGALVQVYVEINSSHTIGPIELRDTGNADPDMVAGDGVYSRYLLEYPAAGRYVFSVHVSGVVNTTRVMTPVNQSDVSWLNTCCGSRVLAQTDQMKDLSPFTRVSRGHVVTINNISRVNQSLLTLAPSRVSDLSISVMSRSLSLSWTAPGADTDYGRVSGHRIIVSPNIDSLLGDYDTARDVEILEVTGEENAGALVKHQLRHDATWGEIFYIGVAGVDSDGNVGDISNLVNIIIPTLSTTDTDDADRLRSEEEDGDHSMVVLGVCVSLLVLAMLLILSVLIIVRRRHRSKTAGSRGSAPVMCRDDLTDNTSCSSDARNNSGNNLMPPDLGPVHTISRPAPPVSVYQAHPSSSPYLFTAPPTSLPDSTPTYWSATKLLTEHEQRALAMSYAPLTGGHLSSVHEEYIGYPEEYPPSYLDDDSLTYSINSRERHREAGIANPSYRHSNGAHVAVMTEDHVSDSGSNLGDTCDEETPVRFSTAVQTIAPSTVAKLRQNNTYLASLRTRNVSLV